MGSGATEVKYEESTTTFQEKRFLDRLGKWSTIDIPRRTLLRRYLETMHLRKEWGSIDKEEIRYYVRSLL